MKFAAALLIFSLYLCSANAGCDYSKRYGEPFCQRPASGDCSQAGTCCSKRNSGWRTLIRECLGDDCDGCPPKSTPLTCGIRCSGKYNADAGAYGEWAHAGDCERPASGACSAEGTCCKQRKGVTKRTRTCEAVNGCAATSLIRHFKCRITCEEPTWSDWVVGDCSTSCGEGTVTSTRTCSIEGGCDGLAEKSEDCNKGACATWSDWIVGECSASCGAGTVTSTRTCSGLGDCDGEDTKSEDCNKGACATWSDWIVGDCSATCGAGTVKSTRTCSGLGDCDGQDTKSEDCNNGACATWSDWIVGECSVTCGAGTFRSTRTCSGLGDCDGVSAKSEDCYKGRCGYINVQKTTAVDKNVGGDMLYLDRHHVWCDEGTALTSFRLHIPGKDKYQYQYSCTSTTVGSSYTKQQNTAYDLDGSDLHVDGKGDARYLDRHAIDCGYNGMIRSFQLKRSYPYGNIRYEYQCNKFPNDLTCHDETTDFNMEEKGDASYLDRHDVRCDNNNGYALSFFRLQRSADLKTIRYRYRCCRTN